MGKGLARDLKIKVPWIDKIFGSMILENGGHAGRYGLLVYENGESSRSDTVQRKSRP